MAKEVKTTTFDGLMQEFSTGEEKLSVEVKFVRVGDEIFIDSTQTKHSQILGSMGERYGQPVEDAGTLWLMDLSSKGGVKEINTFGGSTTLGIERNHEKRKRTIELLAIAFVGIAVSSYEKLE